MDQGELFWRQMDILSPRLMENQRITLIGCGGIGSPVGLMLAKMGFGSFKLYDDDKIEVHNLPNQMFPIMTTMGGGDGDWVSTLGLNKSEVLSWEMMGYGHPIMVVPHVEVYEDQTLDGIVISGVDSMKARKVIWEQVKAQREQIDLYVDARMGAQVGVIYAFNPKSEDATKFFEGVALYSDADSMEQPCTNRAILYNTFFIAALVGRQVRNHLTGQDVPEELIFDLETLTLLKGDTL